MDNIDGITDLEIHEGLKWMIHFTPVLKTFFNTDVIITISDREKVLHQDFTPNVSEKLRLPIGFKLRDFDVMKEAMKIKETIYTELPKEAFGVAQKAITSPIYDKAGEVIGSIGVGLSIDNQVKMKEIAEQFVATSQEISASTEELAASSEGFINYIENLSKAQNSMLEQVEHTTKILEMINGIAKNTRILGFNAGIEAARSGEYGKGFSVVAKEITKLADESSNSVYEIRELINILREKVDDVATIIEDTYELSKDQSNTTEEISKAIQQLASVAEDLEEMSKVI